MMVTVLLRTTPTLTTRLQDQMLLLGSHNLLKILEISLTIVKYRGNCWITLITHYSCFQRFPTPPQLRITFFFPYINGAVNIIYARNIIYEYVS